jgi:hypothetical protein
LSILTDLEEQMWIQTRSNQCPSDVKNFMNSVSRPSSAFNRLGSFTSFGIQDLGERDRLDSQQTPAQIKSPVHLADMGYIYKQSQ